MIKEAIILAGGQGTRLRSVLPDLPKCMANIGTKPFLYYIIHYLLKNNIQHIVFSLGYKSEIITEYLSVHFPNLHYTICIETEPLGTGGAIILATNSCQENDFLIINGDTFFNINIPEFADFYFKNKAKCMIALKSMQDISRYGVVEINDKNLIINFKEKKGYKQGLINGGIYLINKMYLTSKKLPQVFSFEKEILEKDFIHNQIYAYTDTNYFIDIGIPEDYFKADKEIPLIIVNC